MKLRNKKTGEIGYSTKERSPYSMYRFNIHTDNGSWLYDSLEELEAEWDDYEENRVQIKLEKRPLEERLLNLEIKMADAEDDIAMLKDKIAKLERIKDETTQ